MSESQLPSDRSFIDLGLVLTNQIVNTKTKLKEINPTLIYQWQGQTLYNQISGKGTFRVRNSQTNDLIFQCQVRKWKNGIPIGKIKLKKINTFSNSEFISDAKIKEIQSFQGQTQDLKKHGKGTFSFQQFFSSGKNTKTTILGEWDKDILISGILQNQKGTKKLDLASNIQFVKSSKKILESQSLNQKRKNRTQKEGKQRNQNVKVQQTENQKIVKNNFLSLDQFCGKVGTKLTEHNNLLKPK